MIAAVTMVRDEADVLPSVLAWMTTQVDVVIVADNGSTDDSARIARDAGCVVVNDPERAYYQSVKMTALADRAASMGASWVVPFDADEIWTSPLGRIADVLGWQPDEVGRVPATLFDHVTTDEDPEEPDPIRRIAWRRNYPGALPKVAVRCVPGLVIQQGNHSAKTPGLVMAEEGQLVVKHFPYRSAEQFVRKARNGAEAYAASDLPESAGSHWRGYGRILAEHGPDALIGVYREWFHVEHPTERADMAYDPVTL